MNIDGWGREGRREGDRVKERQTAIKKARECVKTLWGVLSL